MIYTSYFANVRRLSKDKYTVVAISGGVPDGYDGLRYKKLAPKYENFKDYKDGKESFSQYAERYNRETLGCLRAGDVVRELYDLVGGNSKHIVLLCYEKNPAECHRSLVSKWLTDNGYLTHELIIE